MPNTNIATSEINTHFAKVGKVGPLCMIMKSDWSKERRAWLFYFCKACHIFPVRKESSCSSITKATSLGFLATFSRAKESKARYDLMVP